MNIIRSILCFYIITLVLIPCADQPGGSEDHVHAIMSEGKQDHDHCHEDDCSPFCCCACCRLSPVSVDKYSVALHIVTAPIIPKSRYINRSPEDKSWAVWQPPKLG